MKTQSLIVTFLVAVLNIVAANEDENFLKIMGRSSDPIRSTNCFNYYMPLIDSIGKTYERNFMECLNKSSKDRAAVDDATLNNRKGLANSAKNSCGLLTQCSDVSSAELAFNCYSDGGKQGIDTMYVINMNSTDYLQKLQEDYVLVENDEYKCTNKTKRTYEADFGKAYDDFKKCNLGMIDVPTTTEATHHSTEATKSPTTAA